MKIAAAGGGTGGHLFPALSIIEKFQRKHDLEVLYFAVKGKIDEKLIKREHPSFQIVPIKTRGLKRPLYSPSNVKRALDYIREILKIKKRLRSFKPDFVLSTGGYAGGLLALASGGKYPLFIHEQNAKPGLANIRSSRLAKKIFLSFKESMKYFSKEVQNKIIVVGNPIREIHFSKRFIDIPDGIVLVLGGSLGSEDINKFMERVYKVDKKNIYVHSTGSKEWVERLSKYQNVMAYQFIDFMPVLWRKAKFVIARAGATTVAEMMYYKKQGILIPWEGSAESHQRLNAKEAERMGLAEVFNISSLSVDYVIEKINNVEYKIAEIMENPSDLIYKKIMEEIQ